jgi:hypothetical protein
MGQIKTVNVTYKSILRSAAFMRGVREARAGIPMDYSAYENEPNTRNRWKYERGRQFGLIYKGAIKDGNRVLWGAVEGMGEALRTRSMI